MAVGIQARIHHHHKHAKASFHPHNPQARGDPRNRALTVRRDLHDRSLGAETGLHPHIRLLAAQAGGDYRKRALSVQTVDSSLLGMDQKLTTPPIKTPFKTNLTLTLSHL